MSYGTVREFDRRKGFGYITPDDGGIDVYVHVSAIEHAGLPNLFIGDRVRFDIQTDLRRAKSFAANLTLA